jgi:aconitate hydratase
MGAEIGATTSVFSYDEKMGDYLRGTGRAEIAEAAAAVRQHLRADDEVYAQPERFYDQII